MKKTSNFNSLLFRSIAMGTFMIGIFTGCFVKVEGPIGGLTGHTKAVISEWRPTASIVVNQTTATSTTPTYMSLKWDVFDANFVPWRFPDYPLTGRNYYHYEVTFDPIMQLRVEDPRLMVFRRNASIFEAALAIFPNPMNSSNPANLQPIFEKHGRGPIDVYIAFTDKDTDDKLYLTLVPTALQ